MTDRLLVGITFGVPVGLGLGSIQRELFKIFSYMVLTALLGVIVEISFFKRYRALHLIDTTDERSLSLSLSVVAIAFIAFHHILAVGGDEAFSQRLSVPMLGSGLSAFCFGMIWLRLAYQILHGMRRIVEDRD